MLDMKIKESLLSLIPVCTIVLGTAEGIIPENLYKDDSKFHYVIVQDGKIQGNKPPLVPYSKGNGYIFSHNYYVMIDGFSFIIPKGFLFDGASVPRPFWSIIGSPCEPDLMFAASIHDFLYWSRIVSKSKADAYIKQALLADGVGTIRANTIYQAVNWCGGHAYKTGPDVPQGSIWAVNESEIERIIVAN